MVKSAGALEGWAGGKAVLCRRHHMRSGSGGTRRCRRWPAKPSAAARGGCPAPAAVHSHRPSAPPQTIGTPTAPRARARLQAGVDEVVEGVQLLPHQALLLKVGGDDGPAARRRRRWRHLHWRWQPNTSESKQTSRTEARRLPRPTKAVAENTANRMHPRGGAAQHDGLKERNKFDRRWAAASKCVHKAARSRRQRRHWHQQCAPSWQQARQRSLPQHTPRHFKAIRHPRSAGGGHHPQQRTRHRSRRSPHPPSPPAAAGPHPPSRTWAPRRAAAPGAAVTTLRALRQRRRRQ